MNEGTPDPSPELSKKQIDEVCRPPALRFSKEMVQFANKKFEGFAPFWCPIIAGMTLQNVLIISLLESYDAGSEEGLAAINSFFDHCKFAVADHWRSAPLAKQFPPKKKKLVVAPG
jgi:hypothetical protein